MIYVISDIHGKYGLYRAMLEKIGLGDDDTLYVMGDVVDRGEAPMDVLLDMMERRNVIPFWGNHEFAELQIMSFLAAHPDDYKSIMSDPRMVANIAIGGKTTFDQFVALSSENREKVLNYIRSFLYYEEADAGGRSFHLSHTLPNVAGMDIHRVSQRDFVWGAADYSRQYMEGTFFVTGHLPTEFIDPQYRGRIWHGNGHIAIDCGAFYTGTLGCIRLDDLQEYYVTE